MEVHYDEAHEDGEHALLDTRTKITMSHVLTFSLALHCFGIF